MSCGRFIHVALRALDWLAKRTLPPDPSPPHQRTGRKGEEAAYFYLRKLGYVMVARNFRSPRRRGDIDLIGWHKNVLCFIEVKTRTTLAVKPPEAAVDRDKQRQLQLLAGEYLHYLPPSCQWRFDVVSVYFEAEPSRPRFELFQNTYSVA
jgi:putative endonuclease